MEMQVEGLAELHAKLNGDALLGKPMAAAFTKSVLLLKGEVKRGTPVNTGRLRASVTHAIDGAPIPLWGQVGTNVQYAEAVEYGTGLVSDSPKSGKKRHWPPIALTQPGGALAVWAGRHNMNPAAVWWAIGVRGGIKPKRMFRDALKNNEAKVVGFFADAAKAIAESWGKKGS